MSDLPMDLPTGPLHPTGQTPTTPGLRNLLSPAALAAVEQKAPTGSCTVGGVAFTWQAITSEAITQKRFPTRKEMIAALKEFTRALEGGSFVSGVEP